MNESASQTVSSQARAAYQRLLDDIRDGRLAPGERLRETDIAQRFGVSRTPVREAIRHLEADGIVEHVPREGARVGRLSYAQLMELYEMRAVLEGTAARFAARVASDVEISELVEMNEELGRLGDAPEAFRLNWQFHAALLNAAKNQYLSRAMSALHKAQMILGPTTLADPERAAQAVVEHREVLDALQARDGPAAECAMRKHIEGAQRVRVRSLRACQSNDGEPL